MFRPSCYHALGDIAAEKDGQHPKHETDRRDLAEDAEPDGAGREAHQDCDRDRRTCPARKLIGKLLKTDLLQMRTGSSRVPRTGLASSSHASTEAPLRVP